MKEKKRRQDLLNGNIREQLLLFFFPIMFGSIIQQLYNTVDAIVLGNAVGKEALGAVGGSTGTFINLLFGFTIGVTSGSTVVISQAYGKGNQEEVEKGVYSGMALAVGLGSILMVIAWIIAPTLLLKLNVPDAIYPFSLLYLRIFLMGCIPLMIYNTGASILRAVGDSKRPLYFLAVACITNIILDILFVVVFHLGISGAAYATVIAQVVSCGLTLYTLRHVENSYRFDARNFHVDWPTLKRILTIGLPIGIQSALYSFSNLFIQSSVNTYGTNTVAAYTAFGTIDALFWNTSGALGASVLTFVGQNYGAGNIKRVKQGMWHGIGLYVAMSLMISGICYFTGNTLYHLFTPDKEVIEIGVGLLRFLCPYWILFCFVEIFSQGMRACGASIVPAFITVSAIGIFRIVWIFFYPAENVFETLVCYPISWAASSTLFLIYYISGKWLKLKKD